MNQVWNIFRKDVRHHWIEITASLALVAAFAWVEIGEWSHPNMASGGAAILYGILGALAVPLTPVSWMFLIVRVVHGESLAGDRQFWVTRPYDWMKLLAAKVLFVMVFINVPLFFAQTFLLAKAGFDPMSYLPGLLWLQVMWTLLLLLPTAALAAVTRSIGQMLLALLFVALFAIGLSILSTVIPNSDFAAPVAAVYFPLVLLTTIAVILLQYCLRRTSQSRWLLAGLAALFAVVMVATPYRTLIAREYPAARADFPLQLSLMPPPKETHYELRNRIPFTVTFSLSGLPKDSFVELNGMILKLTNSTGQHWDSGWQSRGTMLFPDQKLVGTNVEINQDALDKLKTSPVSGDLFLAFTVYHDTKQRPFVVPQGEFRLPDLGFCSTTAGSFSSLSCRIPLRRPKFLMVSSEMAASTCPLSKDQIPPSPGQIARGFIRNDSSAPADAALSSVEVEGVSLVDSSNDRTSGMCPGTPVTLSNPEDAVHASVEMHIDSAWWAAYLQSLNKPKPQ